MSVLTIVDLTHFKPPQNEALRAIIYLGIFPLLMEHQHREMGSSATQLAEYTGAEPDSIGTGHRKPNGDSSSAWINFLIWFCNTPNSDVYRPIDETVAFTQPIGRDGVPCMCVGYPVLLSPFHS